MSAPIVVWVGEAKSELLNAVEKRYKTVSVRSGKRGLELAQLHQAQMVILDAISLQTSGERICHLLRAGLPQTMLIHIHSEAKLKSEADISLQPPLTSRRLMTHVNRLLKAQPKTLLKCGDFALDTHQRVLYSHGQEITLNPKQSHLIELFFRHPNEVLERAWLMRTVWETDYTGDTRTLDVHIRWVRQALASKDQSTPSDSLKTIRGVGYLLEVPKK